MERELTDQYIHIFACITNKETEAINDDKE